MVSSVLCKSLFIGVLALIASLLHGCRHLGKQIEGSFGECTSLSEHDKDQCEACVKNVEDTPFEKEGLKSELKAKCAEGREGQKEVEKKVEERMEKNHNE